MADSFVPTMFPLVSVVEERDPTTGQPIKVGYITQPWRRFQEGVGTAITPGSSGEVLSSNGVSLVWQQIVNANVGTSAAIAWSKISKTGSSLADLTTRSACDLDSGTLNAARLPTLSSSFLNGRTTSTIAAGVTTYLGLADSTTETDIYLVVPLAGTVRNFYVVSDGVAGAGQSFTYTVRKNGSDQALTCSISGASATTGNDATHSFSVAAGDKVTVKVVVSGGASARKHQFGLEVATA